MNGRPSFGLVVLALCGALTGCVERRFVITSDPPGAMVFDEKGLPLGPAPVDKQWTYNGKYQFTLVRDGYQTLRVDEQVSPRWFEYFPLDFFTENVIPYTFRDIRRFHYQMQPMPIVAPEMVLEQGRGLRDRGRAIEGGGANPLQSAPTMPPAAPVTMLPPQP